MKPHVLKKQQKEAPECETLRTTHFNDFLDALFVFSSLMSSYIAMVVPMQTIVSMTLLWESKSYTKGVW